MGEVEKLIKEMNGAVTKGSGVSRITSILGDSLLEGSVPRVEMVRVSDIEVRPQIRRDFNEEEIASLAASIEEHGLIQPVVVVREGGSYVLVAGERRLRAVKRLGWASVPAIVISEKDQQRIRLIQLIENVQRKDLSLVEKAEGIWDYFLYLWRAMGGTDAPSVERLWLTFYYMNGGKHDRIKGPLELYREVAKRCSEVVGLPPTSVLLHVLIAQLPQRCREFLYEAKNITATHLRVLIADRKPEEWDEGFLKLLEEVEEKGLSRRRLERTVKRSRPKKDPYSKIDRFVKSLVKDVSPDEGERLLKYLINQAEAALLRIKG